MVCSKCGTTNGPRKRFCSSCGNQLIFDNPQYQQPNPMPNNTSGFRPFLYDKFSLITFIFLGMITFGIYPLYVYHKMIQSINVAATPYDGKNTPGLLTMILLSFVTFGIYSVIFSHKLSNRVGDEARRRGMPTNFGAKDYWIWSVLLSFLAGGFIYLYKLFELMNFISNSYNGNGR